MRNGEPALETFTDAVYKATMSIDAIKILEGAPTIDLDKVGTTK